MYTNEQWDSHREEMKQLKERNEKKSKEDVESVKVFLFELFGKMVDDEQAIDIIDFCKEKMTNWNSIVLPRLRK